MILYRRRDRNSIENIFYGEAAIAKGPAEDKYRPGTKERATFSKHLHELDKVLAWEVFRFYECVSMEPSWSFPEKIPRHVLAVYNK